MSLAEDIEYQVACLEATMEERISIPLYITK